MPSLLGAVDYLLNRYTDERLALALSRAQRPQAWAPRQRAYRL